MILMRKDYINNLTHLRTYVEEMDIEVQFWDQINKVRKLVRN